ncbi:GntR family transcriptional regulator [Streptomyces olivochromogenes]|uniref:GntR family transcriptional regulator n=1 Tax=Streptomyces olivochromogenes TaxID=1963 RepID=UPI001F2D0EB1|nr:GntR family transcriptional regulator [Streptomyces olivochromogenes]MCF3131191.1 GntR family transcriptional regulator [Streptomyces olivochromogenes]
MPERKYDRPSQLKTIRLPGPTTSEREQAREEFVHHIRDGLAQRRYVFGDVLPTVSEVRDQYGVPEDDIGNAIRELRRAGLLQLHDEYRDTYVLDPGPEHTEGEPQADLAERVRRLEALYSDLAARIEAIEPPPRRP